MQLRMKGDALPLNAAPFLGWPGRQRSEDVCAEDSSTCQILQFLQVHLTPHNRQKGMHITSIAPSHHSSKKKAITLTWPIPYQPHPSLASAPQTQQSGGGQEETRADLALLPHAQRWPPRTCASSLVSPLNCHQKSKVPGRVKSKGWHVCIHVLSLRSLLPLLWFC